MVYKSIIFTNIILQDNKYQWKKTEAKIESIRLELSPNPDYDELSTIFPNKKCEIKYSYKFNGVDYTSDKLGITDKKTENKNDSRFFDNNEFNNSLFEKLKKEKKIFIYVDPEKPMNTTLIKYDLNYRKIGSLIISLTFSIFLGLIIFDNFKFPAKSISKKIKLVK